MGDLDAVAEHYIQKLSESSEDLIDVGFELGMKRLLSCELSPESIKQLTELKDNRTFSEEETHAVAGALGGAMADVDEFASAQGYTDESHPTWRNEVYRGVVKGVCTAWRQVCERMSRRRPGAN